MNVRALVIVVLGLAACGGDEPIELTELGEVCGQPSPVRVLALNPNEQLLGDRPLVVGDRVLYVISRDLDPEGSFFPTPATTSVWSTGPCGESPVKLATDIDRIFTAEVWPGVPLGCRRDTGEVLVLDPTGTREPKVVFADVGRSCGLRWTPHGVVDVDLDDEEFGALLLHTYAADPWDEAPPPVVLADPIRVTPVLGASSHSGAGIVGGVLAAFDDFVLALNPENVLIRADLADASIVELRAGVGEIETSRSGRYVLWQGDTVTLADEDYPEGELRLADLEGGGEDALLAEGSLGYSVFPMSWADEGVVKLSGAEWTTDRLFLLPDLEELEVNLGDRFLSARLSDDRWLAQSLRSGVYDLIDLQSGTSRSLFPRGGQLTALTDESVEIIEVPPCCIENDYRDEGPLWRVPLGDGEPVKLAPRATLMLQRLGDGRLLTPINIDAEWLGTLILVDLETGEESQVDDHVGAHSLGTARAGEEGIISYSVADGDRSGVYLARLPPIAADRALSRRPGSDAPTRIVDIRRGPDGRPTPSPRDLAEPLWRAPNLEK